MAPMDLRLRAWGAVTRRQSSVATRTEAQVIALQNRKIPDSGLVALILGKATPGVALVGRSILAVCLLARDLGGPVISHQAQVWAARHSRIQAA